jgi:hypothetical protein
MRMKRSDIHRVRDQIKQSQSDCCAVCGGSFNTHTYHKKKRKIVPKYRATLDHCHSSGVVRGVLCSYCNAVEGKVKHALIRYHPYVNEYGTPEFLVALAEYLTLHRTDQTNILHPDHLTSEEKRLRANKKARIARAKAKEIE